MSEQERGRYDRSRYGSGRGRDDGFYDDMRISAADPAGMRTVGDYSRDHAAAHSADHAPDRARDYSRGAYEARGVHSRRPSRNGKQPVKRSARDGQRPTARPKQGRAFKIAIIALVAAVVVGVGAAFAYFNGIANNLHEGVDDDLRAALVHTDMANEPFYVLLLGTDGSAERDAYEDFGGQYRSDSMMLARVDPVAKKVTLVSIGRDILVDLGPEYGEQKINSAYALGGPALAVKTVSKLANVPISHYAQVDFDGFSAMVDALGGVEVDVPMSFDDADAGGALEAGVQTLNGEQALVLCRMRNAYSDVAIKPDEMRAANQRLVLSAIAKKALSSDIATIASTVQAMSEYVTTDLELTDIIGLAQVMKGLDPDTSIYTASVPTTSQYIDGGWYEIVNKAEWTEMMKRVDAGEPPLEGAVVDEATGTVMATAGSGSTAASNKQAAITVKNATETAGLASGVRSKLMEAGFSNVVVGEITDSSAYPETVVVYDSAGQAHEAEEIVGTIGQGRAMQNDGSYLLTDADFLVIIGDDWKR